MIPFESVISFVRAYWWPIVVACGVLTVLCVVRRRSSWILAVWLPSLTVAVAYGLVFLTAVLPEAIRHVSGPNPGETPFQSQAGDWGGLWVFVVTLESAPILLAGLLLWFARPPRDAWRPPWPRIGVAMAVVLPALLGASFYLTQPEVTFLVTDVDGAPLGGVHIGIPHASPRGRSRAGQPPSPAKAPGSAFAVEMRGVTDASGRLTRRMSHGSDLVVVFSRDGYQDHIVNVSRDGPRSDRLWVQHSWFQHRGASVGAGESAAGMIAGPAPRRIAVVMKADATP